MIQKKCTNINQEVIKKIYVDDFDYFVQYIRKIIKNKKYVPTTTKNPIFTNEILQDSITGIWNLECSYSDASTTKIWTDSQIEKIINDIEDEKALKIKSAYFLCRSIIIAILNKNRKQLKKLKLEYNKIQNNETLYNINKYYEIACTLLTKEFSLQITNPYNQSINIEFQKVPFADIKKIMFSEEKYNIHCNLMFLGLYLIISTKQEPTIKEFQLESKKIKTMVDKYPNTLKTEIKICESILKLLALTSITYFFCEYKNEGQKDGCSSLALGLKDEKNVIYTSTIDKKKKDLLRRDYKFLYNRIIEYNIFSYKNNYEISPFYVAFEKYNEALNTSLNEIEKCITYIVMGYEAIYTAKGDDLSYSLRMRLATMLNIIGLKREDVLDIIKTAYSIRCDYAHGGINREKETKKIKSFFDDDTSKCIEFLLNILRISLLVILILDYGKKIKSDKNIIYFHKKLDTIMTGNTEIKNEIKDKILKFKNWIF